MTARLTLIGSILLLLFLIHFHFGAATIFFASDQALSFAVVREVLSGQMVWAGPPSHVGGRHLGPFFYWYLSAATWLGGGSILGATIVTGLVKLGFALSLASLWRRLFPSCPPCSRCWGTIGVVLTLCLGYIDIFRVIWHPHALLIFSTLFLFATQRLFVVGAQALLPWAVAGSLLGQTHTAALPLCAAVGLVALLHAYKNRTLWHIEWRELSTALPNILWATLLVTTFIPALLYEAQYDPNIFRLFHIHGGGEQHTPAGMWAAARSLLDFFSLYTFHFTLKSAGIQLAWQVAILMTSLALLFRPLRQLWATQPYMLASLALGCLLTLLALSRFQAPLFDYYWSALLPLPPLLGAVLVAEVAKQLREAVAIRRYLAWAAAVMFAVQLTVAIKATIVRYNSQPFVKYHTLTHATAAASAMRSALSAGEKFEVFPRLHAKVLHNSYYYFLGADYFSALEVSWKFRELSRAPIGEHHEGDYNTEHAYMVVCPKPFSKPLRSVMASFDGRWRLVRDLDLSSSPDISPCLIRLLQRNHSVAN